MARTRLGLDLTAGAGVALSVVAFVAAVRRVIQAFAADGVDDSRETIVELVRSRARIQAAADDERRRIERDLHDGAQQRLVALRVRLALAADQIRTDPSSGEALLDGLGAAVEDALAEVRTLAHGVYPPVLGEFGLVAALKDVSAWEPVRTTVAADGIGRFSPEIEAAVYFCCLEAVQNAAKHPEDVQRIAIAIRSDEDLRFEVSDDGSGFSADAVAPGARFVGMHDRLAAVGGHLDVRAAPGGGTCVAGTVPLPQERGVLVEQEGRQHVTG
jgi:signal transduction histidine kinase